MTPFFVVGTVYTGFIAKAMGTVDISFFVGLPVAGILCWLFTRHLDIDAEIKVADQEVQELEKAALEGTV